MTLVVKFLPPERERLLEAIQRLSLRSEGNPLDWTAQHRLWWENRVDAALLAERLATVERIRVAVRVDDGNVFTRVGPGDQPMVELVPADRLAAILDAMAVG